MNQYDVKEAFLLADMDEDAWTEVPTGFDIPSHLDPTVDWVMKLKKSLYGDQKAPYLWNQEIHKKLLSLGFSCSSGDACFYFKRTDAEKILCIVLHVDDFILLTMILLRRPALLIFWMQHMDSNASEKWKDIPATKSNEIESK
jgi:hypothetical protein